MQLLVTVFPFFDHPRTIDYEGSSKRRITADASTALVIVED
ncbi:hypothetical protein ACFWHR_03520 [Leucobacter sp. NPDC058333]